MGGWAQELEEVCTMRAGLLQGSGPHSLRWFCRRLVLLVLSGLMLVCCGSAGRVEVGSSGDVREVAEEGPWGIPDYVRNEAVDDGSERHTAETDISGDLNLSDLVPPGDAQGDLNPYDFGHPGDVNLIEVTDASDVLADQWSISEILEPDNSAECFGDFTGFSGTVMVDSQGGPTGRMEIHLFYEKPPSPYSGVGTFMMKSWDDVHFPFEYEVKMPKPGTFWVAALLDLEKDGSFEYGELYSVDGEIVPVTVDWGKATCGVDFLFE